MLRSLFVPIIISFCIFTGIAGRALAQCEMGWSNPVSLDWPAHSLRPGVDFDEDGEGPNPSLTLFSGYLGIAGGISVNGLAGWDGTYWKRFPGGYDILGKVESMAVIDEDDAGPLPPTLFIGGSFSSIGGIVAGRVAKYANGAWHGTADGVPAFPFGNIRKLVTLDPDGIGPAPAQLFALGASLAVLSGASWQLVGETASTDFVETDIIIADMDGPGVKPASLIRCGYSGTSTLASEVDRWTGTEWQRLGGLFHGRPTALAMFDSDQNGPRPPDLYAGGYFDQVEAKSIRALARWRDGEWQPLEQPLLNTGNVLRLAIGDDDGDGPRRRSLFVAGTFSVPGAVSSASKNFGRWDGEEWEGMGSSSLFSNSTAYLANLRIQGQQLSRWFVYSGPGNYYVRDDETWRLYFQELPTHEVIIRRLDLDGSGPQTEVIVAAGRYLETINQGVSKCVAAWDGRKWQRLGSNELAAILFKDIGLFDFDGNGPAAPSVVIAGALTFGSDRYVAAALINDAWVPLGSASSGTGNTLAVFDEDGDGPAPPALFLGGTAIPGPSSTAYLARWDSGTGWVPIAGELDRAVTKLLVQDDDGPGPLPAAMYAAGPLHIGNLAVNGIGRWDGVQWSALVDVVSGEVNTPSPVTSLASLEEATGRFTLCASGKFNTAHGLKYAARWNGSHWIPMGATLSSSVAAMYVDDTGVDSGLSGSLYGVSSNYLMRWDGSEWNSLGWISNTVNSIDAIDFDNAGPRAAQLVTGGRVSGLANSPVSFEHQLPAFGIATWGPRQPFYFATPWNRSIAAGDRLSLKVATGGPEPMTFAWTRDGVTLSDGGGISGATTRELIIAPVSFDDSGQYECVATNACGSIPSGPTLVRVCATVANGDVNADGHVNGLDIAPFVAMWTSPASPESDCAVDLTHNGIRDPDDIAWFIGRLLSP